MFSIQPKREARHFDVTVIGGGTAGVFAAISAARKGAKTLLIEKNSLLGGTMTVAGVDFPGLFFAWGKQIIDGPCREAIMRAEELGGASIPKITYKPKNHWHEQVQLNRAIYTHVLNEMCRKAGVCVLTSCMLSHAEERKDSVSLLLTNKSGLFAVETKIAIDATGDANLVSMLGYACDKGEILQPATLQNHISGYCAEDISLEMLENFMVENTVSIDSPITPQKLLHFLKIRKIDIHTPAPYADTSEGKTDTERRALADVIEVYKFLRRIPGLEGLTLDRIAEETGIRETNRIVGETTVTAEDYIAGTHFSDSICYAFYPIDLHVMNGIEQKFHAEGVVAEIPYGALIPKGARRILAAGRCISSDRLANSGLRVEAPCMAMGQAAGCAAALCVSEKVDVKQVNIQALRHSLVELGAIIPE